LYIFDTDFVVQSYKQSLILQKTNEIKTVTIVGAGNVGWHMAKALYQAGITIDHVVSRTKKHAEELAAMVSAAPLTSVSGIKRSPDMFLLCVNDDTLVHVVEEFFGFDALVVHTSGSSGREVFQNRKGKFGVFYPLQSFTRNNEMTYGTIPFFVEGASKEVVDQLKKLAELISGIFYEADSERRQMLHMAAVFACNFSNHLAAIADELLAANGLSFELLLPLIEDTNRKLKNLDPVSSQTGPAVRNDRKIVEKHLRSLEGMPKEQELYRLLTENIIRYRNRKNE
jgi:predicted short-subunit dehydrogenase-like oxidoreductase (DUF2520 family)